jgi:hypothetical protein
MPTVWTPSSQAKLASDYQELIERYHTLTAQVTERVREECAQSYMVSHSLVSWDSSRLSVL